MPDYVLRVLTPEQGDERYVSKDELSEDLGEDLQIAGARQQSILLGTAMRKLRKGQAVKFAVRGDSTTYGHDTVSSDKVPAPTNTLPDGTKHGFTRSPAPWPETMGTYLNQVYGANKVIVENQGFSGDWVQRGYDRWLTNVNADITIIGYGINDASASYVPDEYRGNVELFVKSLEKMILRDLSWGSAVVLHNSTRQLGAIGNVDTETFRNAQQALATKYGVPIIDVERFLENAPRAAWSDGNHLNTLGNSIMAARFAAVFVGEGPQAPMLVTSGSKLLPRPTLSNLTMGPGTTVFSSVGHQTPNDDVNGQGIALGLGAGQTDATAWFSFYTDQPDMVIFPIDFIQADASETVARIDYTLDFGALQGDNYHDRILDLGLGNTSDQTNTTAPATQLRQVSPGTNSYRFDPRSLSTDGIRITTAGWHTLSVRMRRTITGTTSMSVHTLEFFGWRTWKMLRDLSNKVSTLEAAPGVNSTGKVFRSYPTPYAETTDILTTSLPWFPLLTELGVASWSADYFRAPVLKLIVRSYGVGYIEYEFLNTTSVASASAVTAQNVGATPTAEGGRTIVFVREIRAVSTRVDGVSPKSSVTQRELASIGMDTGNNLILNWRTTNSSDNTTAKDMKKAFQFTMSLA